MRKFIKPNPNSGKPGRSIEALTRTSLFLIGSASTLAGLKLFIESEAFWQNHAGALMGTIGTLAVFGASIRELNERGYLADNVEPHGEEDGGNGEEWGWGNGGGGEEPPRPPVSGGPGGAMPEHDWTNEVEQFLQDQSRMPVGV